MVSEEYDTPVSAPAASERLRTRTVLLAGFGLVLGVGLLSGLYFTQRLKDAHQESEAINRRYGRAQEILSALRTNVLLGSIDVRDALLDPVRGSTPAYRSSLEDTLRKVDNALKRYEPVVDSQAERAPIEQLSRQVAEFRETVLDVLARDLSDEPRERRLLLRNRVIPKREGIIRVAEEVGLINREAVTRRQAAIAQAYATAQRRTWTQLALTLFASFVIGLVATRRVASLEASLHEQQRRSAESARDLQRLSAQLVTAQEEERRTIARELHDEVGQALTAIKVELAVAARGVDAGADPETALREARSITERAIHSVRDLSRLLRPVMLDDLGLPSAVETLIKEFRKRHNIATDLVVEGMGGRLEPSTEVAAFRIVQEAMTNVARHSGATSCRVGLRRVSGGLLITIEDNGVGFDASNEPANRAGHGLGLFGIHERVQQLRGGIRLQSAPGRGTRINIVLPASEQDVPVDEPAMAAQEASV